MADEGLTPKVSSPSATVTLLDRALGPSENCPGRLSIEGESVDSSVSDGVDCWVGEAYVLLVRLVQWKENLMCWRGGIGRGHRRGVVSRTLRRV